MNFLKFFFEQRILFWTFIAINILYFFIFFNIFTAFVFETLWAAILFFGIIIAVNYLILADVYRRWKK